MSLIARIKQDKNSLLKTLSILILILGIVIRIVVYLQNRNLFIDEANVARNIYERGFKGLALPLSYEQYAPPVFLWLIKISALLFGYSEYALRLYPLIAGIASMVVFYAIAKRLTSFNSLWYPLFLLATTYIFIRYSSELKQYMSDVLVVLSLLLMALKTDIERIKGVKFAIIWFLAGTIAIWACMPSVFMLAGVGIYYFINCVKAKEYKKGWLIVLVAILWIAQFLFYYITILRPQAESSYLQNFHNDYFLFLLPNGKAQLMHNWYVFKELLEEAGGYQFIGWLFNLILLVYGSVLLLRKHLSIGLLLVVPLIATLLAAALRQYSLIPRVALFVMPIMLLLIGYGLEQALRIRIVIVQIVVVILAVITAKNHSMIKMLYQPYKNEQMTDELSFLKQHNISGKDVYVHNGARPAFIYYTQIHPDKQKWQQFNGAHLLMWDANYDSIAQHVTDTTAFIYTALGWDDVVGYKNTLNKYLKEIAQAENQDIRCYAYIYVKKP